MLNQPKNNMKRPASIVRLIDKTILIESDSIDVLVTPTNEGVKIQVTDKFKEERKIVFKETVKPKRSTGYN